MEVFRKRTIALVVPVLLPAAVLAVNEPRMDDAGTFPAYAVECPEGTTDAGQCTGLNDATYLGWRTYKIECQQCHGGGGMGSTFAPNLMDRINKQGVDYGRFLYFMEHGYQGKMGVMPSMKQNARVQKATAEIYTYLKARAEGAIPVGRPPKPAQ